MSELILDPTIIHAGQLSCWPIQERGRPALPACFDLALGSGLLKLTHAAMPDWVMVSTEHIRIAMPDAVNITLLREALGTGGILRSALVDLRWAAISDRGILTACGEVKKTLHSLAEQPDGRGADHDDNEFDDPVMKPYDRWWYGVERNGKEASTDKPQVLAFPITHANRARERNPNLVIDELHELLADGLSPVMARIGVPAMSGTRPHLISMIDIRASELRKRMSAPSESWKPPPKATPCTAAMTGTGSWRQPHTACCGKLAWPCVRLVRSRFSPPGIPLPPFSFMAAKRPMSSPAQKARPSPDRTTARTPFSFESRSVAATRASNMA